MQLSSFAVTAKYKVRRQLQLLQQAFSFKIWWSLQVVNNVSWLHSKVCWLYYIPVVKAMTLFKLGRAQKIMSYEKIGSILRSWEAKTYEFIE